MEDNPFRVSAPPPLPPRGNNKSDSSSASNGNSKSTSSNKNNRRTSKTKTNSSSSTSKNTNSNTDIEEERPSFNNNYPPYGFNNDTNITVDNTNESSYDNNDISNDEIRTPTPVLNQQPKKSSRSNCCTTCCKIYCWGKAIKQVAQSRNLSHTVLLITGILNFSLFILSCYLLNTPQPLLNIW